MVDTLLSAVSCGFLLVRFVKGPWMRNPQYVAAAIVGAVLAVLALHAYSAELESGMVTGSLAGLAGAWLAIFAFDKAIGAP